MTKVTLILDPVVALFYEQVARNAGIPLEKVLSDTLYKIAGELSLEAIEKNTGS